MKKSKFPTGICHGTKQYWTKKKGERRLSGEFIQVFPEGKKTRINCKNSHSSESACMDAVDTQNCMGGATGCFTWAD